LEYRSYRQSLPVLSFLFQKLWALECEIEQIRAKFLTEPGPEHLSIATNFVFYSLTESLQEDADIEISETEDCLLDIMEEQLDTLGQP
jgi:hypothetical protein